MIFVISAGICLVLDAQASGEMSVMTRAMSSFQTMEFFNPLSILKVGKDMFFAFFRVITWEYEFFHGYWVWMRFLFISISLGIMLSLAITLFRGVSSG